MSTLVEPRPWFIALRWQQYEGEARANLLRLLAIGGFYSIELANYHGLRLGPLDLPQVDGVDRPYHLAVTAIAVLAVLVAVAVHLCLRQRFFPAALKYLSTAADLILLTAVLNISDGARSPLVVGYFLVIAVAGLRFDLPLVWFATLGAMAGYLWLSGYAKWYGDPSLRVPRYYQAIFLLSLALAGGVLGQVLRRVQALASDYAARLEHREVGS
jgi:hypothetical protein